MTETTMKSAARPAGRVTAPKKEGNWLIQTGITLLLFLLYSGGSGVILVAFLAIHSIRQSAVNTGDMSFSLNMDSLPPSYMIVMLWSEILLILVFILFTKIFRKLPVSSLGFTSNKTAVYYPLAFAAGLIVYSAAMGISCIMGTVTVSRSDDLSIPYLILFTGGWMIQGLAEEVMCRGFLMTSVMRRYPAWTGIVVNSGLFAVLHLLNPGEISPVAIINLFLFGVFASLLFLKTKNIFICGAFHSAWNLVQGNIWGVPVSGIQVTSFFVTTPDESMKLINGGTFGLEGGLVVTVIMTAAVFIMTAIVKKDKKDPSGKDPATSGPSLEDAKRSLRKAA